MKTLALSLFLVLSQAHAGELLMDCYFEKDLKTFSLAKIDINDGACHASDFYESAGPVRIRYQIELCGQEAHGTTMTRVFENANWETVSSFSTRKECQLRRRINTVPRRCTPHRC